ncbi:MAG: hypothetical protein KA521_00160 [Crocinitomicaceae bacterium]|nr:hypothetical protein [Crocinitomicaceae bacterium]
MSQSYINAQNHNKIHDSLVELFYYAHYKDYLGNETFEEIIYKPKLTIWEIDKRQQKCEIIYSVCDSIVSKIPNPINHKKGIRVSSKATSGYIDDSTSYWMHPFRSNQYIYTEIVPFPMIYFNKLFLGAKWNSNTIILFGWGKLKGKVSNSYEVIGSENYELDGKTISNCTLISAIGEHNKLGKSSLIYLFHENYGILYMKYVIYNGVTINFNLTSVKPSF